jgi:nucleotide-binding universal stress UspA family protein
VKTILIPVSGGDSDQAVLKMGYVVASSFAAHLDFVHVEGEIADAVEFTRDIDFARGMGLQLSLRKLKCDCEIDGQAARLHVEDFCDRNEISGGFTAPFPCDRVTGKWQSIDHDGPRRLISLARQHDLVIMGRSSRRSLYSRYLMERILLECGRPILLVPSGWNASSTRTVAVWWKDHAAAARAVTAAMPLLDKAKHVSFLSVDEGASCSCEMALDVARELGWHGIEADARQLPRIEQSVINRLWRASQGADLVVMGAFGHSRLHELIFGGCTQSALDIGYLPVFMMH